MSQLGYLSKLPNLSRLVINNKHNYLKDSNPLAEFLQSMVQKGSFAWKSIIINYISLDRLEVSELAKIESIRVLACHLFEWYSIKFFSQLRNLQHLIIYVHETINSHTSEQVLNLLSESQVQVTIASKDFTLRRNGKKVKIYTEQKFRKSTRYQINEKLNLLFQAFATNLSTIEELIFCEIDNIEFSDISKVSEIQTIKKLSCKLSELSGIEKLAELNNLQVLELTGNGSLTALFTKLAERNIIQRFQYSGELVPEEVIQVSRIKSLETLKCGFSDNDDFQSLSELANSSIEELIVIVKNPNQSLQTFFAAFSSSSATRLQHLDIFRDPRNPLDPSKTINISEMTEIIEINSLKSLRAGFHNLECAQMLDRLPNLQHLVIDQVNNNEVNPLESVFRVLVHKSPSTLQKLDLLNNSIGLNECKYLAQHETLESLKCVLYEIPGIEVLANIKNLKELIIYAAVDSLSELYRAFALRSDSNLQELQTPITCNDEIHEISQIKSLKKVNITGNQWCNNLSDLGKLTDLESLRIVDDGQIDVNTDSLLPIFEYCQKLNYVTWEFCCVEEDEVYIPVIKLYSILKAVRNPSLQKPLKLTIFEKYNVPKFHVEDIDEAYLNVSYKYSLVKHSQDVYLGFDY
ncbi:uncharacterized protein LOC108041755 [Drosophila rhopaloa]|uniref:Uncharacterized protein LOC108041755 n=1 Tax=Drosophila rhopaloa TaxID=1041015 RepID=A0A6P4EPN2_DRORH|nr:uncharacterized protein LOC108041755 [Drosophila rhopaloa]